MNQATAKHAQQTLVYRDKKEQIKNYWSKRSHDFAGLRVKELNSYMSKLWMNEIEGHLPEGECLRILDIGTGTGFFAFLLSDLRHKVTGIDLTPSMIEEANIIGKKLGSSADFRVMDAENLLFGDETFDMIITRNLTWTLPEPKKAYQDWHRVLKKNGVLLNFDGNYGKEDFARDEEELPDFHAHKAIADSLRQECNQIKSQLEISYRVRPAWDVEVLSEIGFEKMELDFGVSKRVYREIDEFYNPTPLFMIKAIK